MRKMWFLILSILCCGFFENSLWAEHKKFQFDHEPIDVVIPSIEKDLDTLNLCIAGIKANCVQIRRVIVVSARPLTDQAEWFDEALYPFSKMDCALDLMKGDKKAARDLVKKPSSRLGWYYQQLLKLYAPFVIPGISSNVLILDSDTIFLNPVEFVNSECEGLYNPGTEYHLPYFTHAERLLPGFSRVFDYSGISNHMLFQRPVLEKLFATVETQHKIPFWQAFCRCVALKDFPKSGASEYEIYFNFLFKDSNQAHIRILKWANISDIEHLEDYKARGFDYVSCHDWMRPKK